MFPRLLISIAHLQPTFMSKGPIIMEAVNVIGKGEIEALEIINYDNGKIPSLSL